MNLRKDHYRERRTHAQASSSSYSGKRVPLSFSSRVGASAQSAVSASDAVSPRPGSAKHSPRGWWCARVARKGRVLNVVTRGTGHLARLASFLARRGERNAASAARRRRAQRFKELRAVAVLPTWPGAAPFRLVFFHISTVRHVPTRWRGLCRFVAKAQRDANLERELKIYSMRWITWLVCR